MTSQRQFLHRLRKPISRLILFAFALLLSVEAWAQITAPINWVVGRGALAGTVQAIATDSNYTYIGGNFTSVGPNTGKGVKITKTNTIWDISYPKVDGTINSVVSDGNGGWYLGGSFSTVGNIARSNAAHILANGNVDLNWNPSANGAVNTIVVDGSDIYIGGSFSSIGGLTRNRIAKLNNTDGAAVAAWDPNASGAVNAITVSASEIYVGGSFTSIGGQTRNRIAKLNNTDGAAVAAWAPDASGTVNTIAVSGSDIYVGGNFTSIGGQTRNRLAKLDGTTAAVDASWNPNANNTINTIIINGSEIFVGGAFGIIGGQSRNRLAKLNNTTGAATGWNATITGTEVKTLSVSGSEIFVGGNFASIGGQTRRHVAKLDITSGAADATWDPSADTSVHTIAVNGSDIYLGGMFNSVNYFKINHLAKLDNTTGQVYSTWNPNPNNNITTIAVNGTDVFVGGNFSSIGGQTRNRLAKLNSTNGVADASWNPNPNNIVNTIAISGSDIYVGGTFTSIGGQTRSRLAKLNSTNGVADTSWNPNANSTINKLTISGNDIYVGGSFTTVGGQARSYIAKLNNTTGAANATWKADANQTVQTITVSGNDVYVGGMFSTIGGQSRNRLAKLNTTTGAVDATWNPNTNNNVYHIALSGSDIYVAGTFKIIDGSGILKKNYLAKLNNTTGAEDTNWNPNPDNVVYAMAIGGTNLFVGGSFTSISGKPQTYLTTYTLPIYTWTGAISSDWNDTDNWYPSKIPIATDHVVIPSGTPNPPNLNNLNITVDDFTQSAGQILDLGSGTMNVTGYFTNNGTITGTGKVVLSGTATQIISGSGTVSNLEINSTAGAAIGATSADTLKLTGLLTLTSGTLTTNNKLVLKSTAATHTAMIGPIPASGTSITGYVIHERFLSAPNNGSGGRSWRLLTSPFKGSLNHSIFYHWQNNGVNNGKGIELFSPTGTGAAGNGLAQGGVTPSIRSYNAATNTYQNVSNTKNTLLFTAFSNNTFLVFVPGHYGSGNITSGSGITNVNAFGTLITGQHTYNFTAPNASNKYFLIGNPYACPIDFDKVYQNSGTANINRKFWVIDPNLSNIGAYVTVTYNSGSGTYITSAGNQNQYLQTGQGFFVEATTPNTLSSVAIEENDKETSAAQTAMFRTNGGNLETFRIKLHKNINNVPILLDGTVVTGHQNSSNNVDSEDGGKFGNFNENISIWKGNNTWLAIESRSLLDNNDTLNVAIGNMLQTSYQLEFEPTNMNMSGLTATLIDHFTNTTTPISLTANSTYSFTVTANAASQGTERFDVVFSNTTPLDLKFVNLSAEKKGNAANLQWTVSNQTSITAYEVERSDDGKAFSRLGVLSSTQQDVYTFVDEQPLAGINYYRIKALARSNSGVYSSIVKLNMHPQEASLSTYPNPATGNTLQVNTGMLQHGTYYLSIFNTAGKRVATKQIMVDAGVTNTSLSIETLAPGIYLMQLMNNNGESLAEQKIIRQ